MFLKWPWNKMLNLKVDGQLFLCTGGLVKKRGKKILKNKWFSVWMELSETISSVYTPAVDTRRAWASWSAGSGGDGALWVTSAHKWLPVRKEEGGTMGGGAIFCVVKPQGRLGWYTETPAQRVSGQCTIYQHRERERREVEISLNSSVSARVVKLRSAVKACICVTLTVQTNVLAFSRFARATKSQAGSLNLSCRAQVETVPVQNTCFCRSNTSDHLLPHAERAPLFPAAVMSLLQLTKPEFWA